jgi:hypothetical protein
MEKSNVIRFLNRFIIISLLILLIVAIIYDLNIFYQNFPNQTPQIWFLDDDLLILTPESKGFSMFLSSVFGFIGAFAFLLISIKLYNNWKQKKENFVASTIFYSAVYLLLARLFEATYVMSETDFHGVLTAVGQFYFPWDALAISLFMVFSVDVFLAEDVQNSQRWTNYAVILSVFVVIVGLYGSIAYWLDFLNMTIPIILTIPSAILYFIIGFRIVIKIAALRKRVGEKQEALFYIMFLLILFLIAITLMLISLSIKGIFPVLSYQLRAGKNFIYIIIAVLYYLGIIKPAKK